MILSKQWLVGGLVALLFFACPLSMALDIPDQGIPDSAYFGATTFELNSCTHEVTVTLPVYLYSDSFSWLNIFQFYWYGSAICDTLLIFETGGADSITRTIVINQDQKRLGGSSFGWSWWVCPTVGTELFLELSFTVALGDSFSIEVDSTNFNLRDPHDVWFPLYLDLNKTIYVPDTLIMSPGDADCTGFISISDAVFLIHYIFAGGCSPYDSNSADADGSCLVTISDVVYLINYIFAGGPAPQAGCVVR
ncbi:MAG: hypothetical protein WBP29_13050 [Candidatus Zixiibacteriota bacterium]